MIPMTKKEIKHIEAFPRMSGDDPHIAYSVIILSAFSPHERG